MLHKNCTLANILAQHNLTLSSSAKGGAERVGLQRVGLQRAGLKRVGLARLLPAVIDGKVSRQMYLYHELLPLQVLITRQRSFLWMRRTLSYRYGEQEIT